MATLRIIFFSKEWWYILKVSSIKKFLLTKGLCLNLVLPFMNCYHGALNIRWKDWSEAPILWPPNAKNWLIWKKTLMLGRLKAQGDNRGRDAWMASPTQWTWVWASSGRWWRTGRPGVLQAMGSQSRTWVSDWTTTTIHRWNLLLNRRLKSYKTFNGVLSADRYSYWPVFLDVCSASNASCKKPPSLPIYLKKSLKTIGINPEIILVYVIVLYILKLKINDYRVEAL